MADSIISATPSSTPQAALARWDDEGGALENVPTAQGADPAAAWADALVPSPAEWQQLRVRVIALENLVLALLAEGSPRQRELARQMAGYISPRPGCTPHPLTLHAAAQMLHFAERAGHFQQTPLA